MRDREKERDIAGALGKTLHLLLVEANRRIFCSNISVAMPPHSSGRGT